MKIYPQYLQDLDPSSPLHLQSINHREHAENTSKSPPCQPLFPQRRKREKERKRILEN